MPNLLQQLHDALGGVWNRPRSPDRLHLSASLRAITQLEQRFCQSLG
jgi:hypothetical protein